MKKLFLLGLILFLLAGCGKSPAATSGPSDLPDAYPAGGTTEATNSAFIPQVSGGSGDMTYPAPAGTVEPTALTITSGVTSIYLITLEDNGVSGKMIGCNDSVVPVEIMVDPGADALRAALDTLLGLKDQYYGQSGLYNALYQSDLTVDKIEIEANEIKVGLVGTMMLGGECDNPRFGAQLSETVAQFAEGREVKISINDKTLEEALSLK
jgi:hypothetical protein